MLNQHENLVVPKSDHLQVGNCVVDIARREVQAPGASVPRRITVKALQVLLVLVAHRGKVVSREALLEWVWSGTMPGDDVLTQAVTQLRKAFGDERDAPRYLETIAKGGYRLLADVSWLPTQRAGEVPMSVPDMEQVLVPADAIAEEQAPVSALVSRWSGMKVAGLAVAACLAVLAVFAGFAWHGSRSPPPQSAKPSNQLGETAAQVPALAFGVVASQPGLETLPSLSPDGSQLAYAMNPVMKGDAATSSEPAGMAIYVQTTAAVSPRRLTDPPPRTRDTAPHWSPDGRQILFIRASEDSCELMMMAASGGTPWQVGSCLQQSTGVYDWLPDGSGIIAGGTKDTSGKDIRLHILSLKTGEWRALSYRANPGDVDFDPHVSPDGKWIVFRRNISNSDFWRMPFAGGTPERLTHLQGNIWGWDFTPDGKTIVFSYLRNGAGLYRYDFASKQVTPLGIESGQHPDIALRAPVMAFEISDQATGLFRRAAPLDPKSAPAQRLFPSSGSDLMPSVSPDGTRIAFYSDRTRELRLWFGKADGSGSPVLVENFIPIQRQPVRWMEDGNSVLAIGYVPGEAGAHAIPALFAIDLRSGRVRKQALPAGLVPVSISMMPPQRLLMVADMGDGRLSLRVLATGATPWRELARRDGVGEARYDATSDAVWYARTDVPGLWRTDPALKSTANVDREQPWVYWMRLWLVTRGKPYSMQAGKDCAMALRPIPASEPTYCLEREVRYAFGEPVLTRDAGWLYFSASTRPENIDIGTVELD